MKDFWFENKKIIVKLMLQQFGAAFFALAMILAAASANTSILELLASGVAIVLYLYLLYSIMWEKGGQDRIKIDGGRAPRVPLKGLYISLAANIPNIIIALLVIISNPFKYTHEWAGNLNVVGRSAGILWEAMYDGLIMNFAPKNPIAYVLIILPALVVCEAGYLIGMNNKKILGFLRKKKEDR